jgi:hypothetical protein
VCLRTWFGQVICGMLAGKTRVVVTHQLRFVRNPAVDTVLVLGVGGAVIASGSYDSVMHALPAELCENGVVDIAHAEEKSADVPVGAHETKSAPHGEVQGVSHSPQPDAQPKAGYGATQAATMSGW